MGPLDSLFEVRASTFLRDIRATAGPELNDTLAEALEGRTLDIGIDQSTAQTGVAFADAKTREILAMVDLTNAGFPDAYEYKQCMLRWFKNVLRGRTVNRMFIEVPLANRNNYYARKALDSLRAFLADFPHRIPELKDVEFMEAVNTLWKGHYLKSKEYDGFRKATADVKESVMLETHKRVAWSQSHTMFFNKPPDSCDAVGVLLGSYEEITSSFSQDILRINKFMQKKGNMSYRKAVGNIDINDMDSMVAGLTSIPRDKLSYNIVEYNPTMTWLDNAKRWASNYKKPAVMIITNDKARREVKWEFKVEPEADKLFALVVTPIWKH